MSFVSRILSRIGGSVGETTGRADGPRSPEHDESSTFVGRAAGEDAGYLDTGAERRARDDERSEPE